MAQASQIAGNQWSAFYFQRHHHWLLHNYMVRDDEMEFIPIWLVKSWILVLSVSIFICCSVRILKNNSPYDRERSRSVTLFGFDYGKLCEIRRIAREVLCWIWLNGDVSRTISCHKIIVSWRPVSWTFEFFLGWFHHVHLRGGTKVRI